MFEEALIKTEKNMFQEEKNKKTNYATIFLVCFFCCFSAFQFMKHLTTQSLTSSIAITDNYSTSSDKLSEYREVWRERPPSTYCFKIESFTKIADSPNTERFESRPFESGGYNWTLIVYPKGNLKDGASPGWISHYVQIDNSTLLNSPKDVYAEVKFFMYNRDKDMYFTYQESDARRFSLFKPYWGKENVVRYSDIANSRAGWILDSESVVFGVDVFVAETFNNWEVLSFTKALHNRLYNWTLKNFSLLDKQYYLSDKFVIGGKNWALKVYPSGDGEGQGNSLSLYVVAVDVNPYDKIYLNATLRVLNQKDSNHVEKKVESWSDQEKSWGFQKFVPFADLRNTSKGLLVDDTLKMEIEFGNFSSTKYYPS